ncbi:MAG: pimeloyl-ACP methyl ester carboxylesterase [Flavobacteriales bacterium]|jgi:pimeloyl-ACP methyl ester carboxylesterase|tara:strand:+ start:662 stop:1435 length:774 start_codon:yes stop_codon:yes gene_type:complete
MLKYKIYKKSIDAQWVTFIHGAGGSSKIWFKQIKAFTANYNVLLIDLRGHGESKGLFETVKQYSFRCISEDVIDVLDFLKIKESHFVGISLGTIIIRNIAEIQPSLVKSMIMAGAILKFNLMSQILMRLGYILHRVLPHMAIYKSFALIILPRRKHKSSRNVFVNEAKKLFRKEFIRWYKLTSDVNPLLRSFRRKKINKPSLFIMGGEDYMFLSAVELFVQRNFLAQLNVIPDCGHIVNVQAADHFNRISLGFLSEF